MARGIFAFAEQSRLVYQKHAAPEENEKGKAALSRFALLP